MNLSMPNMSLINTTVLNKSLSAMVKGIRGHKDRGEVEYINKCLAEIKEELATPYTDVKAQALQKLIYLQMIGYDISWASFNIVEVMSAPWFGHKRIGYLAASLCFTRDTDVILLTTHLFRKGFTQPTSTGSAAAEGLQYETGAAIACLSNIATPDLAMDLLNDVYGLMNSSRPYLRKKAVLVLLRLFKQWPKALRLSFDRLKEKLDDENPGVVSAAVYVICELAAKNPKNYLSLAPQFFKILTTSSNNWVLIKVVKLLGCLSPLEPRLAKKLQDPLTDVITTTPAKSLLYECVNTLLAGEIRSRSTVRLCLDKLRSFIEDADQNLKYLGLLGLHRLMRKHPRVVAEHRDLVLNCLEDEDVTIRMRALDLITSMVSARNVQAIIRKMHDHLQASEGAYRDHVLQRILSIGSQDNYAFITDFEWYISVLVELTHLTGTALHTAVAVTQQLTDVSIRVPGVRRFAVKAMSDVLLAGRLLKGGGGSNSMSEVLHAAAFIVGEYSEYVEEHVELLRCMMRHEVAGLSADTQNVFLQAAFKVLASGLYQPFDVSGEDRDVSLDVKVKDLLGRRERRDDDDDDKDEEGDDIKERQQPPDTSSQQQQDADVDPEQEEEELDASGVKKRKVKARRRTFHDYCVFVGEMLECLYSHLPVFTRSAHVEVQERAVCYHEFVLWLAIIAHLQPFISVPLLKRDGAATAEAEEKEVNGQPPADLLDDSAVNGSLPPAELLQSLAVQVNLLFSERLNPVNPRAQRKVPVPKGLNLEAAINPGWDVDSDKSEAEQDDSASEEDDSSSRRRRHRDKKRDHKDRSSKDKERRRRDRDRKPDHEVDYSKPQTEQEKTEAKRRLEARRAAQASDPYYVKDRPTATVSSGSALLSPSSGGSSRNADDVPVKRLGKDDLPAMHVRSEGGSRRKKGHSKEEQEADDIFAGVGSSRSSGGSSKVFKVRKNDEMPSGAESSDGAEADRARDDDLSAPLGEDDVIPTVKPYGSKDDKAKRRSSRHHKADRDDKERRHKERDREREKDGKERKDRSRDKERDKEKERDRSDARHKNDKPSKKDRKDKDRSSAGATDLDLFDPMSKPSSATQAAAASGDEDEVKGGHKHNEKSRDRDRDREKDRKKDRDRDRPRDKKADRDDRDSKRRTKA